MIRSHTCGELGAENIGEQVSLCGWVATRRDHGGVIFADLRDRYGITQVVFDPKIENGLRAHEKAGKIRSEFVIWCEGKVRSRPEGMVNSKLKTGAVEVACVDLEIFSEAETPPFDLSENAPEVAEAVRLKYRYLDLRRATMQRNLFIRHQMLMSVRRYLDEADFLEIETPVLYKSTPEGARDFIVPSRMHPGRFYALPQSPQTLKQLLMISGLDRYYQVARCFRDEDLRADRQPEFSQIDIETSFLDQNAFFPLIEEMVKRIWKEVLGREIQTPFPRMAYAEAMARFGSDKPDLRFGLELQDLSDIFAMSDFKVFQGALQKDARGNAGSIRALLVEGKAERFSRKDLDDLAALALQHGAKGLLWIKVQQGGELQSPAAKFFKDEEKRELHGKLGLKPGDLVLIVADRNKIVFQALGALRLKLAERLKLLPENPQAHPCFLWVTDFPLLEFDEKEKRYFALHHPFTSPAQESMADFLAGTNLDHLRAAAYDLVLDGVEVAGGSLRIYRKEVQDAMFRALGLSEQEAKEKFGFFLEALRYGTPPHGGIAFGVERLSAILAGVGPIRDVMAFPKTQKGQDLMADTPAPVYPEQLTELGISLIPSAKK